MEQAETKMTRWTCEKNTHIRRSHISSVLRGERDRLLGPPAKTSFLRCSRVRIVEIGSPERGLEAAHHRSRSVT